MLTAQSSGTHKIGPHDFDNAAVTIPGIELAEKIKKGQYKTGKLGGRKAKA